MLFLAILPDEIDTSQMANSLTGYSPSRRYIYISFAVLSLCPFFLSLFSLETFYAPAFPAFVVSIYLYTKRGILNAF